MGGGYAIKEGLNGPAYLLVGFSRIGPSARNSPHHVAQKSTITGTCVEASRTSFSNVAAVTLRTNREYARDLLLGLRRPCGVVQGLDFQDGDG